MFNVYNLKEWINENRDLLKPPVCNKEVYPGGDFIIMIIGGPNERKDYHYNETPEFFYQIEGDATLKLIENGEFKDVLIKEGDMYLLPAGIPHSPQRGAGTVGLVIEMKRKPENTDGFQWYCDNCHSMLYEEYCKLVNISQQLPEIFNKFNGNETLHKCSKCGDVLKVPAKK
ncbi:MAG: 3-hydroxyanthranilate 3,4-dioxygenase [Bacteroidetes bacterium]|nr:MAG: 3-hydroxyanthranilate 3,4-dioxygenase [Bacteroidota bacterium]